MILRVDPDAATPPYEQLRLQLTDMIVGGVLREGERLPSIRQLAGDLMLAPGTVRRAYTELEREGLVHPRRGRHGSFVAPAQGGRSGPDREAMLREAAQRYAISVIQAGANTAEALDQARLAL